MPSIIIPGRWNKAPDYPTSINNNHPFADRILDFTYPLGNGLYSAVSKRASYVAGTNPLVTRGGKSGIARSRNSASGATAFDQIDALETSLNLSTAPNTLMIHVRGVLHGLYSGGYPETPGNSSSLYTYVHLQSLSYGVALVQQQTNTLILVATFSSSGTAEVRTSVPNNEPFDVFIWFDRDTSKWTFQYNAEAVGTRSATNTLTGIASGPKIRVGIAGASAGGSHSTHLGAAWSRALNAEERAEWRNNPWQILLPNRDILYFDVGGGGADTQALNGASSTASVGTATAAIEYATSGSQVTTSVGTVTKSLAETRTLAGTSVATSAGTETPSIEEAISGQSAATQTGTITGYGSIDRALNGQAVASYAGTLTKAIAETRALAGAVAATFAGVIGTDSDVVHALTGSAVTSAYGSLVANIDRALTGLQVQALAGVITGSEGAARALAGQATTAYAGAFATEVRYTLSGAGVTVSAGTVTKSIEATKALTGQSVAASAGTMPGALTIALVGSSVTTDAGYIGAGADVTKAITGSVAAIATGTVISQVTHALIGQVTAAYTGSMPMSIVVGVVGQPASTMPGTMSLAIYTGIVGSQAISYVGVLTAGEVVNIVRNAVARGVYVTRAKQSVVGVTRNKHKGATI